MKNFYNLTGDYMNYSEVSKQLTEIGEYRASDIDKIVKYYLTNNFDVSDLLPHIQDNWGIHSLYFGVSLKRIKDFKAKFTFIEKHFDYLNSWYDVDKLIGLVRGKLDFNYCYNKAKIYIKDKREFVRRWGYVLFLAGLQKDPFNFSKITNLLKNDKSYYVVMGEAWLIADLAVYNQDKIVEFLTNSKLDYQILSKAISKINDSFRIDKEIKEKCKQVRIMLKK